MSAHQSNYDKISGELNSSNTTLVAVSKIKPVTDIKELYDLGQRDFGENYVQELVEKAEACPNDIRWHFIGHLQSNKVKYIAPFVHLIQGVDSEKLLHEISKQGQKLNRIIHCLLQVHIAEEETKFGFEPEEATALIGNISSSSVQFPFAKVCGLMGMASFSDDTEKVKNEFRQLHTLYNQLKIKLPSFNTLSMGMSGDYKLALECGSNMVRIGSLLFGARI